MRCSPVIGSGDHSYKRLHRCPVYMPIFCFRDLEARYFLLGSSGLTAWGKKKKAAKQKEKERRESCRREMEEAEAC